MSKWRIWKAAIASLVCGSLFAGCLGIPNQVVLWILNEELWG